MKYTKPDYYDEFVCIAADCPATCCAGWQIMIDQKSLDKYSSYPGPLGNRLHNSIDWKTGAFKQYDRRCAFLNEENLCDLYDEAGEDMLCRTCKRYPRHMEEFENERELSLSLSCPVVARMLLGRKEQVRWVEKDVPRKSEEDDSFDLFLYSALQDCRNIMFTVMQNRELPVAIRLAEILALAHDVQNRVDGNHIFEIENLLERYTRAGAHEAFAGRLERFLATQNTHAKHYAQELFQMLGKLETLDPEWPAYRDSLEQICREQKPGSVQKVFFSGIYQMYGMNTDMATETEQLMIYYLYTYFCGAVYDGQILSKVKMAICCILLIRQMEAATAISRKGSLSSEDRAQIVWRFSRELEHSDINLNQMEKWMDEQEMTSFESLMGMIAAEFEGENEWKKEKTY
jgi:lysine-N-methylase